MTEPTDIITHSTSMGTITGLNAGTFAIFRGIPYATAKRFEYATPVDTWSQVSDTGATLDATRWGDTCPQKRVWYAHLEQPERMFYHREFREGIPYTYSEDCLTLNIYMPNRAAATTTSDRAAATTTSAPLRPVIVFIHGGGFDSGANYDSAIHGERFASDGYVFVSITYRVGVLGYCTHQDIAAANNGRDGNFGLDDQFIALQWIKNHIADFAGDPLNITVMGQSAGAISIQYLCCSEKCRGLFQKAFMVSGGGKFPDFALPRPVTQTREYWLDVMTTAGCTTFDQFRTLDIKKIYDALETVKSRRRDNTYNTMPVIDGYLIPAPIQELILHPLDIPYIVTYTNNDMYAWLMAHIGHQYACRTGAWLANFDVDSPGDDNNKAFHSSDIRYWMNTLNDSHRPYTQQDQQLSELLVCYLENYATTSDPNRGPHTGLPQWSRTTPHSRKALHLVRDIRKIRMKRPNGLKMFWYMMTKGEPK